MLSLSTQLPRVKASLLLAAMMNVQARRTGGMIGHLRTCDVWIDATRCSCGFARRALGGPGSGNFGHAGRPGEVGGSDGIGQRAPDGILAAIHQADGGFTYHAISGTSPTKGYAVSVHKDREQIITAHDVTLVTLAKYAKTNRDLLSKTNNYLGGWHNPNDHRVYLDVSTVVSTHEEAKSLGARAGQLAYFDLERGESVEIKHVKAAAQFGWQQRKGANHRRSHQARATIDWPRTYGSRDHRGKKTLRELGGPGSGNFGHAGRPGEVGGSSSEGGASERIIARPSADYHLMYTAGRDTLEQFSDGHGHYTKERAALHGAIIAKHMQGTTPVKKPIATILGGGPASGKTEIVNAEGLGKNNTVHVDVDEIRKSLPEYREGLGKDVAISTFTHEESSDIAKQLVRTAIDSKRNVLLDGTGDSSIEKLGAKAAAMRAGGHEVVAKYVTVDVETAVARAHARGEKTGRYVPETFIRETHAAVSRTFPEAIRQGLFDRATLYDTNASASLESAGRSMRPIVSARGRELVVHDQAAWERFLAKGQQ